MNLLLKLQGVSWLLRQAIILATISLHTTHTEANGSTVITIQNVANGGIKGTTEVRHLDWQPTEHQDYIWGHVRGSCGYKLMQDVADARLQVGWLDETRLGECIQNDVMAVDESWQSSMVRFDALGLQSDLISIILGLGIPTH